ncbi:hypothetical protein HYX17_01355 [Candidatus Woesearchaeota archaeon]|nr:hypothetical protein [Candidatus Woesearchaeota archaeon]
MNKDRYVRLGKQALVMATIYAHLFAGAKLADIVYAESQLPLQEKLKRIEYRLEHPVLAVPPFRGAIVMAERMALRKEANELTDKLSRLE